MKQVVMLAYVVTAATLQAVFPAPAKPAEAILSRSDKIRNLEESRRFLAAKTLEMLKGCRRKMKDGTVCYPPQVGCGYEAFWLRDFGYMLEGAADLFPQEELLPCVQVFLNAQRADGAGADCVKFDGNPIYQPGYGTMGENPVADGSPFTVGNAYLVS